MSEQEKEIYRDITEKLDDYHGGEILLEKNISPKSLARISDTIRYGEGGKYWYFVVAYPFNEKNRFIMTGLDQPSEKLNMESISKILIEIDLGESQGALHSFQFKEDKYDILTNYEEFKSNPTYESMGNGIKPLWNIEQLLAGRIGYHFAEHFEWE